VKWFGSYYQHSTTLLTQENCQMYRPEWFEAIYEEFARDHGQPWYKRWVFIGIIDPIDDFFCWWGHRVHSPWLDLQNAIMRVKKGHDWTDVWNMNSWFINNAVPILEHWLAQPPMGHPVCLCTTDYDVDDYEMTYEKWVSILTEMLEGFKLYKRYEGSCDWPTLDAPHPNPDNLIGGKPTLPHIGKGPPSSYWHEDAHYMIFDGVWNKTSMTKTEYKKFKRSLFLFTEYFETLWD
jgi:hypothetical protein